MQPEERDLIVGLFGRLNSFEAHPRDPEADQLIASAVAAQPSAPYLLVQTVLVQEQALKGAQQRIAELEAKVAAAAAPPSSFLANAPSAGPWGSAPSRPPGQQPMQQQPMQQQAPQPGPFQAAPAAGGGFLRQAMMTAAGVAGGALLFEGIRDMMGHTANPFGVSPASAMDTSNLMPSDHTTPPDPTPDDSTTNDTTNDATDNSPDEGMDDYDTTSDDSDSGGFDNGNDDI